jgi:hypothetical protein
MPIFFTCVCGLEIEAMSAQVGCKVMCPVCRSDLVVPRRPPPARPEPIPDLGIVVPRPSRLTQTPRRVYPKRTSAGLLVTLILLGSFGLCFVLVIAWGLAFAPRRQEERKLDPSPVDRLDAPSIGQDGFLGFAGGKGVLMARSDTDWDDFIEAKNFASAGGDGASGPLQRMLHAGRVQMLRNGTRIRVRNSSFTARFVEVVEGENAGSSGWIELEYVRRTPP